MPVYCPRLMIAGTSGDSGKTIVSVGLARAWSGQGVTVYTFKKGPDYIDASWLSAASGETTRNLDTYLIEPEVVKRSFFQSAISDGINLIEGNRGVHDGMDVDGSHSSAALSKLIKCPVILVQDITKITRSAAAFILGSKILDEEVNIAGVILNRVAGTRHEMIARKSIENYCDTPVLGAIPKLSKEYDIRSRHLGLITPREESGIRELIEKHASAARKYIDLKRLEEIAGGASSLDKKFSPSISKKGSGDIRICYLNDLAFSFYYPENLEKLEDAGAELIPVSALDAKALPECDALYIGGGFPETHARVLTKNSSFRQSLYRAAEAGLPIYAECGGLIYLAKSLIWQGDEYPMAGVFPIRIKVSEKPQGHGYACYKVDCKNPFFKKGVELKGHEFHYSNPESFSDETIFEVKRGSGFGNGRDGMLRWNVLGTYLHIHALGCPQWAPGVVKAAKRYRKE